MNSIIKDNNTECTPMNIAPSHFDLIRYQKPYSANDPSSQISWEASPMAYILILGDDMNMKLSRFRCVSNLGF